ncbi:MAG: hypothetical protein FWD47_03000 [Treponema sp.]|nr:hypothetical protein [Treponema sp.]
MKKEKLLIFVGVIFLLMLMIMLINPAYRPTSLIRNDILKFTPIGMNMDEVLEVIEERNNWRIMTRSSERGYIYMKLPPGQREVGIKHISVDLGNSWYFWYVISSWAFDENGILIDVFVERPTAN